MADGAEQAAPRARDGCALALAALALYVALAQETLYGDDGLHMVLALRAGEIGGLNHFAQRALRTACHAWLAPFLTTPQIGALFSASGAALGVWLAHRCCRALGLTRARAVLATTLVALSPPVVFFATVVEVHAAFLPFAHLNLLAALRAARAPTCANAILLGLAGTLAFTFHASAIALPALTLPLVLWFGAAPARTRSRCAVLAAATHVLAIAGWVATLRLTGLEPGGLGGVTRQAFDQLGALAATPRYFVTEWLLPFLPLSFAWLVAAGRPASAAFVTGLLASCALSAWVLAGVGHERGAYLLPLALPAAILVANSLPRAALVVLAALAGVLAVRDVAAHDVLGPHYRGFAAGLRLAAGDAAPFAIVADIADVTACCLAEPPIAHWRCQQVATMPGADFAAGVRWLPAALDSYRARGHAVLLSRATLAWLEDGRCASGPALAQALREREHLRPVTAAGFAGFELRPR